MSLPCNQDAAGILKFQVDQLAFRRSMFHNETFDNCIDRHKTLTRRYNLFVSDDSSALFDGNSQWTKLANNLQFHSFNEDKPKVKIQDLKSNNVISRAKRLVQGMAILGTEAYNSRYSYFIAKDTGETRPASNVEATKAASHSGSKGDAKDALIQKLRRELRHLQSVNA